MTCQQRSQPVRQQKKAHRINNREAGELQSCASVKIKLNWVNANNKKADPVHHSRAGTSVVEFLHTVVSFWRDVALV